MLLLLPKLQKDLIAKDQDVSEACIFAPKLKKPEAKALALALFPEVASRQEAYIQYFYAIKRLKQKFATQVRPKPSRYLFYHD